MSRYILDTNVLVDFQSGHELVCARLLSHSMDDLAISVISVEEQLSGWYTLLRRVKDRPSLARAYQRLADSTQLLGRFRIESFTLSAIDRFEQLKVLRLGVKHTDLRIAAIALESDCILVTANTRDFDGIPELRVENWQTG